jgi:hypothetical protein
MRRLALPLVLLLLAPSAAEAVAPGRNARIIYQGAEGSTRALVAIAPDGTGRKVLALNAEWPGISPDGRRLAYLSSQQPGGGARLLDLETGTITPFAGPLGVGPARWSPDGSKIVGVRGYDGKAEVVTYDVATGQVTRLGHQGHHADWTPDGRHIVFERSFMGGIAIVDTAGANLHVLHPAGGRPSVSPDGRRVAFHKPPSAGLYGNDREVWVMDITGENARSLVEAGAMGERSASAPAWSPDGTRIAFRFSRFQTGGQSGRVPLSSGIATMPANGGPIDTLTSDGGMDPTWDPGIPPPPSLEVALDGWESGPDEVTLVSRMRNVSAEGPVTELAYPGGPGAGLILNTAPYREENRGALALRVGPEPFLPSRLGAGEATLHSYILDVTRPGVVMARVRASGKGPQKEDVEASTYVEIVATPRLLEPEQAEAVAAGAYVQLAAQAKADADAALLRSLKTVEQAMGRLATPSVRADLRRDTPSEDLLAELYGLPAGSLDFLPDKARAYLTWTQARSNGELAAWKRRLGGAYDKTVRVPAQFWRHQFGKAPLQTSYLVGRELYRAAGEKTAGLRGFMADARSLLTTKSMGEVRDGLPALGREYRDSLRAAATRAWSVSAAKANELARAFRSGDAKAIKASAEWFAEGEVAVADALAKEAIANVAGVKVLGMTRSYKAAKQASALEAAQDAIGDHGSLDDVLPRTITDGLAAPSAARLGMSEADQALIGGVLRKLEDKAARLGFPGLKLEAAFRSRGYSAPGAIGKVQYLKGKTGAAVDLLLGMDKAGLGNQAIYKPRLPSFVKDLPADLRAAVTERFKEQSKAWEEWGKAARGEKSKLAEMFKATGKAGNRFKNVVNGQVADETFMRLAEREVGGTKIIEYVDLEVNGTKIVKGRRTPIGSDYDGLYLGLEGGRKLPAGVASGLWLEANKEFRELAAKKGFAWGFHGLSRDAFDFGKDLFENVVWQYIAEVLPEADALRLFGAKGEDVLKKMTFGQYAVKVTARGATTGVLSP